MDMKTQKLIEKYEEDFDKISSKEGWEPNDITIMKDLQKLMYYIELRCAMKEGQQDNWEPSERSYRGQSRGGGGGGSGAGYGGYGAGRYGTMGGGSGRYYDERGGSGRRYYDDEKESALGRLYKMMESEANPEARMAIQMAIRELENK